MLAPDGSNVGGATVSLNYLVEYIDNQGFAYQLIDTKGVKSVMGKVLNPILAIWQFLMKINQTDVVFVNLSQFGAKTIAPLLYILTRLFGKRFIFRPFGGAMIDHYEKYWAWQRWLFKKTLLQSDIFYLQTKQLCNYFAPMAKRVEQLPTSRYAPAAELIRDDRSYAKRFVFLGHINRAKGCWHLSEAIKAFDDSYTLHFYGPIHDSEFHKILRKKQRYKGVLDKAAVAATLREYDVLVLPTHYRGEGYPGVIIEAYSLGLPVITTDWRAIPEIVVPEETGFIVRTKSAPAIAQAMQAFDKKNYPKMSKRARQYFEENHEANTVTSRVIQQINQLFK